MNRTGRKTALVSVVLITILLTVSIINTSTGSRSGPDSDPPAAGDWYVNTLNNVISHETLVVNGSLTINESSSLRLEDAVLVFATGDSSIIVNGTLELVNSTITSGTDVTGLTGFFSNTSDVSLDNSVLNGFAALTMNSSDFACESSTLSSIQQWVVNNYTAIYNSTLQNFFLTLNATIDSYNIKVLDPAGADALSNGTINLYQFLSFKALNASGGNVSGGAYDVTDLQSTSIASGNLDAQGEAGFYVLIRWMNASGWFGLQEALVNVSVTDTGYSEYAWTRLVTDVFITIRPGNKAPVALIDGQDSAQTYADLLFNASYSFDPDNYNITLYQWDFGDGVTASGAQAEVYHTYQLPGDYSVALTVHDDAGASDSTYMSVHVDWVINQTVLVEDRDLELNSFVQILGNGSLTLDNVRLAFNASMNDEYPFTVYPGGELKITGGSLVTSGALVNGQVSPSAGRGRLVLMENTTFHLIDSVVDGLGWGPTDDGGISAGSDTVVITGSIIRNNYEGLYLDYAGSHQKNITITDTQISGNKLGLHIYQEEFTAVLNAQGLDLVDNEFVGLFSQSDLGGGAGFSFNDLFLTGSNQGVYLMGEGHYSFTEAVLYNNSLGMEVLGLPGGAPILTLALDSVDLSTGDVGLDLENMELTAYNTTFTDMSNLDLDIYDFAFVRLNNCSFNSSKVNMPDTTSQMWVNWILNVRTVWPNDSPINGAFVNITDSGAGSFYKGFTGPGGWIENIWVHHYLRFNNTDAFTQYADTHLIINASVYGSYYSVVDLYVNQTTSTVVTLMDTNDPSGSILINNGTAMTNSFTVSLTLWYSDVGSGVEAIALSNQPFNSTNTVWEEPAGVKLWGLEPLQGNHTVYYKVMDASGAESPVYTDSIDADTIGPASYVFPLELYRKSPGFTLEWGPKTGTNDIAAYTIQYSFDGEFWQEILPSTTASSFEWTGSQEGDTTYFRSIARDAAGNIEVKTIHDTRTIIDSIPPQTSLLPMELYQTSLSVNLAWTGYDRTTDISGFVIEYAGNAETGPWETLASGVTSESGTYDFPAQGGFYLRTIGSDKAGNTEAKPAGFYDIYIVVDTIPPQVQQRSVDVSDTSAVVTWTTNEVSKGVLFYGRDKESLVERNDYIDSESHSIILTSLEQNTDYYYKIMTFDPAGNTLVDDNDGELYSFTTSASYGRIFGLVTDSETTRPVAKAGIYIGNLYMGLTNSTGHFSFWVPEGDYDYMVEHRLYDPFKWIGTVHVDAGGEKQADAQLIRKPGTTGSIAVTVKDEGGDGLEGANIKLFIGDEAYRTGSTNAGGVFELDGVNPGTYSVLVTRPGYLKNEFSLTVVVGETAAQTVELEEVPEPEETPWILRTNNLVLIIVIAAIVIVVALVALYIFRDKLPLDNVPLIGGGKGRKRRKKDKSAAGGDDDDEEGGEEVVECPSCDSLVSTSETRCPECGESLYEIVADDDEIVEDDEEFDCPFCGEEADPEDEECDSCGQEIPSEYKKEYYERLEGGGDSDVKAVVVEDAVEEGDEEVEEEPEVVEEEEEEEPEEEESKEEEVEEEEEEPGDDDEDEDEPGDDDEDEEDEVPIEDQIDDLLEDDDLEDVDDELDDWEEDVDDDDGDEYGSGDAGGSAKKKNKKQDIEVIMI